MRRYLLAGGGVVAVMLATALLMQQCASGDSMPEEPTTVALAAPGTSAEPAPPTGEPTQEASPAPQTAPQPEPLSAASAAAPQTTSQPSAISARIESHLRSSVANAHGSALPASEAALLEAAKDLERDIWPTANRLVQGLGEEEFPTLLEALEVQMAHDPGAAELAQLFSDGARGKLPADGSAELHRLACGMRVCAADFEADAGWQPSGLGYNSMSIGSAPSDGRVRHRLIFSIDPALHLMPTNRAGG